MHAKFDDDIIILCDIQENSPLCLEREGGGGFTTDLNYWCNLKPVNPNLVNIRKLDSRIQKVHFSSGCGNLKTGPV
jgi:hypothetical protein